tara:strand:- start:1834 stop:2244 length:411 start_codon:yes stop_codon:yes gene_type:complete
VTNDSPPDWRVPGMVGVLLLLDTVLLKFSVPGPWDSPSFTLGVIGLSGVVLLYISWFRLTFQRRGLVPWTDMWEDPQGSARKELGASAFVMALAWLSGNHLQEYLPRPTGLVLSLVGMLMFVQAVYVMLSFGPLAE